MSKSTSTNQLPSSSSTTAAGATTGVTSTLSLDDDHQLSPEVNVSCLDFLLIELVPLAQRITEQMQAREQKLMDEWRRSKILSSTSGNSGRLKEDEEMVSSPIEQNPQQNHSQPQKEKKNSSKARAETLRENGLSINPGQIADENTRSAVFWRLDGLGYRVGQGLVERFSADKPRPTTPLEAIKFVCKELWPRIFRKPVDNLKTNHRGVFVLGDSRFAGLGRVSVDRRAGGSGAAKGAAAEETLRRAQAFLYFPCGVIRGALAGLGIEATVTAETTEIPAATFQIKTKGANP